MDWNLEAETIISQLLNGDDKPFNRAADAAWFNRALDDDSRLSLARALAKNFDLIKDIRVKASVLRLMGWADSVLAHEVALKSLDSAASAAVCHAQYLYESVLVIARERTDLFSTCSLSFREISKNLRLSYALLRDKPIIDGDCLEADEINNVEYSDFLTNLYERKS